MDTFSLLTPLGYEVNSCGYCKSGKRSAAYYCHGYRNMRPADYEALANRSWRRSGTTYYKPDPRNACCPHYTIRLDADNFKVSKDQKRVSNSFTSYILGEKYKRKAAEIFPKSREYKKQRNGVFDVCDRVHEAEWNQLPKRESQGSLESVEPTHRFEVTLESDKFTEEKYKLFEQYQRVIHKEPPYKISKHGFRSFLCSGLTRTVYTSDGRSRPIGSYHQCYRLDGQLVAIGVLDLLPNCVSSVYLIYHTDFSHLEFGKLSALREIALAKEQGYRYYYMGYYIHSCIKMRYKRSFKPCFILDPESYEWNLFDRDLLAHFDTASYVSPARERRLKLESNRNNSSETLVSSTQPKSRSGTSIFSNGMTGLLGPTEIKSMLPLSNLPLFYDKKIICLPKMVWDEQEMYNPRSIIGRLAEFVACIGMDNLPPGRRGDGGIIPCLDWIQEDNEVEDGDDVTMEMNEDD